MLYTINPLVWAFDKKNKWEADTPNNSFTIKQGTSMNSEDSEKEVFVLTDWWETYKDKFFFSLKEAQDEAQRWHIDNLQKYLTKQQ